MLQKLLGMVLGRVGGGGQSQLLGAAMKVLGGSSGGDGLTSLLGRLSGAGLGGQVQSWLGSGSNEKVSARDMRRAIGDADLARIASEAGVSKRQAAGGLAAGLPGLVDQLSPGGSLPGGDALQSALGGLLGKLG